MYKIVQQHYFICSSDPNIEQIPRCKTVIEEKCFFRMKKEIQPQLVKKPCTKLQYSNIVVESTRKYRLSNIEVRIKFAKPLQVRVKTEYLLMDFLSMIGAVGGTLGLCIGFSFKEVLGFLLDLVQIVFKKGRNNKKDPTKRRRK